MLALLTSHAMSRPTSCQWAARGRPCSGTLALLLTSLLLVAHLLECHARVEEPGWWGAAGDQRRSAPASLPVDHASRGRQLAQSECEAVAAGSHTCPEPGPQMSAEPYTK